MKVHFRVCDPQLLHVITKHRRIRAGGKPAADRLLKPIKPTSKRAAFLRWHLDAARPIADTMTHFKMKRPNVMAYWTALNRDHGVGYTLADNTITAVMPDES